MADDHRTGVGRLKQNEKKTDCKHSCLSGGGGTGQLSYVPLVACGPELDRDIGPDSAGL